VRPTGSLLRRAEGIRVDALGQRAHERRRDRGSAPSRVERPMRAMRAEVAAGSAAIADANRRFEKP